VAAAFAVAASAAAAAAAVAAATNTPVLALQDGKADSTTSFGVCKTSWMPTVLWKDVERCLFCNQPHCSFSQVLRVPSPSNPLNDGP